MKGGKKLKYFLYSLVPDVCYKSLVYYGIGRKWIANLNVIIIGILQLLNHYVDLHQNYGSHLDVLGFGISTTNLIFL